MLNLENYGKNEVADNTITINGKFIAKLSDKNTERILSIIEAMNSGKDVIFGNDKKTSVKVASDKLSMPEEKATPKNIAGEVMYHNDTLTVTKFVGNWRDSKTNKLLKNILQYRVYIHVPYGFHNRDKVYSAIKHTAVDKYGAIWTGNFDKKDIHWSFAKLENAEQFIAEQKERASKYEKTE